MLFLDHVEVPRVGEVDKLNAGMILFCIDSGAALGEFREDWKDVKTT